MSVVIYFGSVLFTKHVGENTDDRRFELNHFPVSYVTDSLDKVISTFKSTPGNSSLIDEYDTCVLNIMKANLIGDKFFNVEKYNNIRIK